jgi:hypothetical protein
VARVGEGRNVYRVLVGKPEGKRPLEKPRRRWEDWIKIDLGEIGSGGVEWIHLAQDRDRWRAVVNAVMNLRVLAPRSQSVSHAGTANVTHRVIIFRQPNDSNRGQITRFEPNFVRKILRETVRTIPAFTQIGRF